MTWKANSSKTWKGHLGSLSKTGQVATRHNLHSKAIKITTGLNTHVLEGEGDIFFKEKETNEYLLVESPRSSQIYF
jgi:hypothetical protein